MLPVKTIADIRALHPCYDPVRYIPEDWTGTARDILRVDPCPAKDRLWVVLNTDWIDNKTLRLFACWCARQALNLIDNPDPLSIAAINVAERYAYGEATDIELIAAWASASASASAASRVAASWAASWASASVAARVAARASAARDAQVAQLIQILEEQT